MNICRVAVNYPRHPWLLTYQFSTTQKLERGQVVSIPLGKRTAQGVVWDFPEESDSGEYQVKSILECTDEVYSARELLFYEWMSSYYHYPLGKLIFDVRPKALKKPRKNFFYEGSAEQKITSTAEQEKVIKDILSKSSGFAQFLVHGITGSGKSIIALKVILEIVKKQSVLYLVPEINLTPQLINFFKGAFVGKIFVFHSGLTPAQKNAVWQELQSEPGPALVVGVRSSLFLPLKSLGLIVIDEEHDLSYKQENRCQYHARDAALKKAQIYDVPVILLSATPSLETYHRFQKEGLRKNYYYLQKRYGNFRLPEISYLNLCDVDYKNHWPLHPQAVASLKKVKERGEQALVFVNRLGFAHFLQCAHCGHTFECRNCHTRLRYFHREQEIRCHHCQYHEKKPEICPDCQCLTLMQQGFGTEKVEEVLKEILPQAQIARFDRDEITTLNKLEKTLNSFMSHEIDILVGTQMLAKGHNFKKVNYVLILGADGFLHGADFRAQENLFQMITQVAGRSGRFADHGQVQIQTRTPELRIFEYLAGGEQKKFYDEEVFYREKSQTPPLHFMGLLRVVGKSESKTEIISANLARELREHYLIKEKKVQLLGPRPALTTKIKNKYTWVLALKSPSRSDLHLILGATDRVKHLFKGVEVKIVMDPYLLD